MMNISTHQDSCEGREAFKVSGTIKYSNSYTNVTTIISASGSRKSQAVEKAIDEIDILIKYLQESKSTLGKI